MISVKRDVTTETAAMDWWCRCFAWFVSLFWHFVSRCRSTFVIMTLFSSCIWHVAFWNMRQRMQPASQTKHSRITEYYFACNFHMKAKNFWFFNISCCFWFCSMWWHRILQHAQALYMIWMGQKWRANACFVCDILWILDFMFELQSRTFGTWMKGFSSSNGHQISKHVHRPYQMSYQKL